MCGVLDVLYAPLSWFLVSILKTSAFAMAASKPEMGRPWRKEGNKRLKFRNSTYNMPNERKEALGFGGITNSEFAEILLHQNFDVLRDQSQQNASSSSTPRQLTF